jgi:hypothetical protein
MPTRRALLQAVAAAVDGLATVEQAVIGVPAPPGFRRTAYVALGLAPVVAHHTTGTLRCQDRIIIGYLCEPDGDVAAAELDAADFVDELQAYVYAHKSLGGLVKSCDLAPASAADYELYSGVEARVLPVPLVVMWDVAFSPNQT